MLMKQVDHNGGGDNIRFGDTFTDDEFDGRTFDYFLTNPPFGVDWKKQQKDIRREHQQEGFAGRFGAGLPRVSDGSLLFLQHMIAKFERFAPDERKHGSRLAIVFSGSPLFAGGAGSGESEIRRWLIENDWLEAIVALPEQMFYNTGIGTYVWIVTNRKEPRRRGRIQLVDARETWTPGGSPENKRSLGDKRRHLSGEQIDEIVRVYGHFADSERSKIFDNADFGYTRVTIERPLRLRYRMTVDDKARFPPRLPRSVGRHAGDRRGAGAGADARLERRVGGNRGPAERAGFAVDTEGAEALPRRLHRHGLRGRAGPQDGRPNEYEPDPGLRDFENVPLKESIDAYFEREVHPHVPDAWMDRDKDRIGYEISFNRHFYRYTPPRPLTEIDADLRQAEDEIVRLLREVVG